MRETSSDAAKYSSMFIIGDVLTIGGVAMASIGAFGLLLSWFRRK